MQETTNYKFKKRELTDVADITATEGNWDIVDTQLNEGDTKVGLLASLATRIKTSIVNAINGLQQDVDAHLAETATDAHKATPACRVYNDVNQSIADDTETLLTFNKERYDTDAVHDVAINNSRLTCKTAGKYLITANVTWGHNASGTRSLRIFLNGNTLIASSQDQPSSVAAYSNAQSVATVYQLNANDYVEMKVKQTSGVALDIISAEAFSPEFSMIKVG